MNYWPPYVPVAVRRQRALKEAAKMRKRGFEVQPVDIEGRKIARTLWGKAWCDHLEKFSDYASRLPRGRTYVRNGSVFHLSVKAGGASALVSGSEIYNVDVKIDRLPKERWSNVIDQCTGEIGSLVDLLQGRLSGKVMRIVTDRDHGMFPSPAEIHFTCDCLDWASMCKHVAAVLYGIGSRLDKMPESLFLLRNVDPEALIPAAASRVGPKAGQRSSSVLDSDNLSSVFGVEIDAGPGPAPRQDADVRPGPAKHAGKRRPTAARQKAETADGLPKGKRTHVPGPAAAKSDRRLRGLRCYEDRLTGLTWAEISRRHGYKHDSSACVAARNFALASGRPWPVPLDSGP